MSVGRVQISVVSGTASAGDEDPGLRTAPDGRSGQLPAGTRFTSLTLALVTGALAGAAARAKPSIRHSIITLVFTHSS